MQSSAAGTSTIPWHAMILPQNHKGYMQAEKHSVNAARVSIMASDVVYYWFVLAALSSAWQCRCGRAVHGSWVTSCSRNKCAGMCSGGRKLDANRLLRLLRLPSMTVHN